MFSVFLLYVLLLVLNQHLLCAIQINTLTVPNAVQNNSGIPVTLDCNYTLRPGDKEFVLKWFLHGDNCVYQWQPPKKPLVLGALRGRLDMTYKITDDPMTEYRGLRIVNPTTDLEGEYKCYVSSQFDEDFDSKTMIVFEPEDKLIMALGQPENGEINFTCSAYGVYPEPELTLFKNNDFDMNDREKLEVVEWTTSKHHNRRYDMTVVATSLVANLTPGDIVDCELKIPQTGYVKKKSLVYYPPYYAISNGSSILSMLHIVLVVAVWLVLFI